MAPTLGLTPLGDAAGDGTFPPLPGAGPTLVLAAVDDDDAPTRRPAAPGFARPPGTGIVCFICMTDWSIARCLIDPLPRRTMWEPRIAASIGGAFEEEPLRDEDED